MRHPRALGALVGVALLAVPALWSSPAGAVQSIETGYWSATQTGGGVLPPPPTVPAKGLWVSSNPTGPQAYSAIRFSLQSGESAPVLTLKVHQVTGTVALLACATTKSWKAGDAQDPAMEPTYDCAGPHSVGAISADNASLTIDLSGVGTGTVVSVALVPSGPDANGVSPVFDITFEPVTSDQIGVTTAPADTSTVSSSDTASTFAASTQPSGGFQSALPSTSPALSGAPFTPPTTSAPTTTLPLRRPVPALASRPAAAAKATSSTKRLIEGAALLLVMALAVPSIGRTVAPAAVEGSVARPRLSLYDAPPAPDAAVAPRPRLSLYETPPISR